MPEETPQPAETGKNKGKILMVEDDMFLLKLYSDQFSRAGFDFGVASNGIEGMHKVQQNKPDLILLDLMLPKKNGFEMLEELQKNKDTKDIPVIVITNLGQESDIKEARNLGAKDYLIKTDVRVSDVLEKIKKWLEK